MTPPPVSETAAWTEQDEDDVQDYASLPGNQSVSRLAREFLRLRAENERLGKWYDEQIHLAFEVRRLRSELAVATRERETPDAKDAERWRALAPLLYLDGDSWPDGKTARAWLCVTYREFPPESETPTDAVDSLLTTSRSRVSDNG